MFARLLTLLLLLSQPLCVFAESASPQGVWNGSIGTKSVVACFNDVHRGNYYYVDYLKPIALLRDSSLHWFERHETGELGTGWWEISAPADGVIVGIWRNKKTGKTFPIRLTLMDGDEDEAACARDSYNLRLEKAPKVEKGKILQFSSERSYRALRFVGKTSIELLGPDPGLGRINAWLKFDRSKKAIDGYFQQRREFLARYGSTVGDDEHVEPVSWDSNFITLMFHSWKAGTGMSGISNVYRTWNTKTGEMVR